MSIESIFTLEFVALVIGYAVLTAGGLGLAAVMVTWPLEIAWRKWGNAKAFIRVAQEAKRQGRPIWGVRDE